MCLLTLAMQTFSAVKNVLIVMVEPRAAELIFSAVKIRPIATGKHLPAKRTSLVGKRPEIVMEVRLAATLIFLAAKKPQTAMVPPLQVERIFLVDKKLPIVMALNLLANQIYLAEKIQPILNRKNQM